MLRSGTWFFVWQATIFWDCELLLDLRKFSISNQRIFCFARSFPSNGPHKFLIFIDLSNFGAYSGANSHSRWLGRQKPVMAVQLQAERTAAFIARGESIAHWDRPTSGQTDSRGHIRRNGLCGPKIGQRTQHHRDSSAYVSLRRMRTKIEISAKNGTNNSAHAIRVNIFWIHH